MIRARNAVLAAAAATLLAGCVINSNKFPRPRDLPPNWLVDRLRVLAVAPEPPEATPGQQVSFSALIADPDQVVQQVVWVACPPTQSGDFGCNPDLSQLPDNPTPEDLQALGVIGLQPLYQPVYTPPSDLLDGLDPIAINEGVEVTIQVVAMPAITDTASFDYNQVEAAFKRLVVSEAATPNHNPVVASFTVEGEPVSPDQAYIFDAGVTYHVGVRLTDDSVEHYRYLNSDGAWEDRTEEPFVTLYASDGDMAEQYGLYADSPLLEGRWTAPSGFRESGTLYAAVRDRRGGMAWAVQPYTVR